MTSGPPVDGASPSGAGAVPVCPRHPDRVSYVRCQRCERPVCPQCQRQAAVGVQCVDCVKAAGKSVRAPRTAFGGRLAGPSPTVTYAVIGVTVLAYLLQRQDSAFTARFLFAAPYALSEPWRFLTAGFLHSPSSLLHIGFNMVALYTVGPYLEGLFGRVRFLVVYLIAAVGGSVGYFLLASPTSDAWSTAVVGASGAVFGLFGALLVANRRLGRDSGPIFAVLAVNVVIGFVVPGIAWQAHAGGFVTGAACAAVLAHGATLRSPRIQVAGLVGIVVALVALVALKAALAPAGSFF